VSFFLLFSRGLVSIFIRSSLLVPGCSSVNRVRETGDNPNSEQNALTCRQAEFDIAELYGVQYTTRGWWRVSRASVEKKLTKLTELNSPPDTDEF